MITLENTWRGSGEVGDSSYFDLKIPCDELGIRIEISDNTLHIHLNENRLNDLIKAVEKESIPFSSPGRIVGYDHDREVWIYEDDA